MPTRARRTRTIAGAVAATLAAGALAVVTQLAGGTPALAAASEPYTWKNVRIDGGGFVPGIIFNPTEQNLIYARTDIGGAYRWNQSTSSWTPLLDWAGWDNWNYNGVLSLATDPVQTNKVYAAVGMYLNSWDPNNGAILRSSDKGATWAATTLPFKVGGNMPGRGMGERLAIDPNKNSTLYFGTEAGNGLWRSTDSGVTWAKVTNFPNVGNYVQDAADTNQYLTFNQGVVWVAFDKSTGTAGNTTQAIYVGVADLQNTVYRSLNGGTSWERVAGQPTGFLAHQGEIAGGYLYITTSDKGGPYDGGHGDVWKMQLSTGTWTQISPVPSTDTNNNWFGYSGLSVDKQNPNTLMVTGYSSWYPDTFIWRSTDGGATWKQFYDYAWPNRTNKYTLNISGVPWLDFNEQKSAPEQSPKLGWMTEALEIDPFNSNRMMFGTGATIYGTTNVTALDTGGTVALTPMIKGLEETAVLDLISPPTGAAPLISGVGDIGGFRHTDLTVVPDMFDMPYFGSTNSLDYAELNPSYVVRVGKGARTANGQTNIGVSSDGGANWWSGSSPSGAQGGTVALNANGTRVVWSTEANGVFYATSFGGSFTQATGAPATAKVEADRVNANKFYAAYNGTVYVSTNGGQTFTAAASGLGVIAGFKAIPGVEGELWLASDTGLYRSTNSGTSFTKFAASASAVGVGFGKAAPGRTNMAVYTMATIDGVRGVYRSNDAGASWVRINDAQHQWGNAGDSITGDPRTYGRVYLGTNGRGIVYGDTGVIPSASPSASTSGSPSASASASPSPSVSPSRSASPSPSTSPSASPSPQGGKSCSATYKILNSWPGGFQGEIVVTNTGSMATTGWRVNFSYTAGQVITQLWGGVKTQTGAAVQVTNEAWNGGLAPGGTANPGFNANYTTSNPVPSPITCTAL
ncbi:cellulose binding domain-containing protein [Catellatospora tritici]|uniref:cellulose binding domain-containing protein n=1 Tax=Catellatospora tritici TaxID=2851566 RepID=UPI001C2D85AF|nr:cellulose binding domain-containing protein [Catellatospora tritici]MBV1852032.1 cellulose binding domain-containing protein [Catellatospora tritici]